MIGLQLYFKIFWIIFIALLPNAFAHQNVTGDGQGVQSEASTNIFKGGKSCGLSSKDSMERLNMLSDLVKDIDRKISSFQQDEYHFDEDSQRVLRSQVTNPLKCPRNLAYNKRTFASSVYDTSTFYHTNAVDGKHFPNRAHASTLKEVKPWLGIDLEETHEIYEVKLYFRASVLGRGTNLKIYLSDKLKDKSDKEFGGYNLFINYIGPPDNDMITLKPRQTGKARYIYIMRDPNPDHLDISEIEVFGI